MMKGFYGRVTHLVAAALLLSLIFFVTSQLSLANGNELVTVCASGCDYDAIQPALDSVADDGTVMVSDGVYTGTLLIDRPVTLTGESRDDTIIDGARDGSTVVVEGFVGVTIENVTITGGSGDALASDYPQTRAGGGILNMGHLTINNVLISDNVVRGLDAEENYNNATEEFAFAGRGYGGGIYVGCESNACGSLHAANIEIRNNSAIGGNASHFGGVGMGGGVMFMCVHGLLCGSVTIKNSSITSNAALMGNGDGSLYLRAIGGGISHFCFSEHCSPILLENVNISHNEVEGYGGGIYSDGAIIIRRANIANNSTPLVNEYPDVYPFTGGVVAIGEIAMTQSVVHNNVGTGVYVYQVVSNGVISNSTIAHNKGRNGGGITFAGLNSNLLIENVTIAYNENSLNENESNSAGGGLLVLDASATVHVVNSILTANISYRDSNPTQESDCSGSVMSLGYNLISGVDSCDLQSQESDLLEVSAELLPLGFYGGPTQSMALSAWSQAIDAVLADNCPPIDQRGYERPFDADGDGVALCDIGAFEGTGLPTDVAVTAVGSVDGRGPAGWGIISLVTLLSALWLLLQRRAVVPGREKFNTN